MAIPDYQGMMLPVLRSLEDGAERTMAEVRERVATAVGLTPDELAELLPSGKQAVYANRIGWAKTDLEKARALETIRRGTYRITKRGKKLLADNPRHIDARTLSQFQEYAAYRKVPDAPQPGKQSTQEQGQGPTGTPRERMEAAYKEVRDSVEQEVLATLLKCTPAFFERVVVELLVNLGYGGSLSDAKAIGKSGDGGLDGIIKEDRLGLDIIYVQAKRWQNVVGRPEIQAFAGSLDGERAKKGVFITTSWFSSEARSYVKSIEKKIILIDGKELASLMVETGLGVTTEYTFAFKRVDQDFFTEE